MHFFHLMRREMQGSLHRLLLMSGLAGASNAAILAAIGSGAQAAGSGTATIWAAGLFIISLFVFIKAQHYILISSTVEIGAIIHKLRLRLMDQVRRSELLALEATGRSRIVAAVTGHTAALTLAANSFAMAGQGIFLLVFVAIYILYLSPLVFALSVIIVGLAAWAIHAMNDHLARGTAEAAALENRLFERLNDFLDGFKEVRLNRPRSDELFEDAVEVSRLAANIKIRIQSDTSRGLVFAQSSMYVLLGAMVFVVPSLSDIQGDEIANTSLALIFVVGACFGAVQTIPIFTAANVATENIERLEAGLRLAGDETSAIAWQPSPHFGKIEMRNVVFRYVDKSSEAVFQIGPVDFTLQSGDLVFITGGNGSGKSTFLKVLAGLYQPDSGEITRDGLRINENTREDHRVLIAAIFSDYHLFHRLYGIPNPDPVEIDRLLTQFRLLDKTRIVNGEFSTLDLSGGQRKRLALIVSLLEERPILLLDEWTAEQDPEFRRKFYDDLLPALSRAGVTVVMVTHDDRHLDELTLPARRLRMEEGRFVERHTVENG